MGASRSPRVAWKCVGNPCQKRSRKPPRAHFGPPGAPFRSLGVILDLLKVILGLLGLIFTPLLGHSWEPLGSFLGLQNPSRRLSRRPPAPELDFGSILGVILGVILAPFWDPLELKTFREFLVRSFSSERSSSILGKAEKRCEPQRQPVALLGRYAPSPAI